MRRRSYKKNDFPFEIYSKIHYYWVPVLGWHDFRLWLDFYKDRPLEEY